MSTHPITYDVCVIGGGINGVGIARDAAGRGLSVALLEQDDLAQGTSSRSGKLVHGGLRYLEYFEFRLVREALIEREVLLESAPHIIWPMRFVLPHSPEDRPVWLIRIGLFLYDHLGGRRRLAGTRSLNLSSGPEGLPLKPEFHQGFEYSDCWVDDSRLVALNAVDAAERGASIMTRRRCTGAKREVDGWRVQFENTMNGQSNELSARVLVNAAGPWVNDVIDSVQQVSSARQVRLVKGSHIIVRKFWEGNQAYLIQNTDKRVIFINPYESDLALIGTTDIPYAGDPAKVTITQDEIDYLLKAVNRYFIHQLNTDDIVQSFSGVRPLYDDKSDNPSAVTRDYLFDIDARDKEPPLLSVFGGKITTFRKLSEHAIDKLHPYFNNLHGPWSAKGKLPGGDIPDADFDKLVEHSEKCYPALPAPLIFHYARCYGSRIINVLSNVTTVSDLGTQFGELFFEKEVRYLATYEWAKTPDDILDRRTKHGLHITASQREFFSTWFQNEVAKGSISL